MFISRLTISPAEAVNVNKAKLLPFFVREELLFAGNVTEES